ncbi:hypothetical protein [Halobacillus sp. Cin3]|uniref:hypothetical protein n=1 Tax=Halobacillus sp. Cin3 TaxID=2928441 RepID=UPI00248D76F7|nr:hypothetical protein [Halobacillus sp. Cin3]
MGKPIFFRPMTSQEKKGWNKGVYVGFYTYLFVLFINFSYETFASGSLLSAPVLFWSGLAAAFVTELLYVFVQKRRQSDDHT